MLQEKFIKIDARFPPDSEKRFHRFFCVFVCTLQFNAAKRNLIRARNRIADGNMKRSLVLLSKYQASPKTAEQI